MFVRRNEINEDFHTTRSVIELEIAKVRHKFRPTGADTFSCNKLNFSLVRFFSPPQFSPLFSRGAAELSCAIYNSRLTQILSVCMLSHFPSPLCLVYSRRALHFFIIHPRAVEYDYFWLAVGYGVAASSEHFCDD